MTWGFVTPGHFFAPGLSGFPGVLAPRLLGGRMLAGGWRVKNGPIGLDQKAEALPMTSGDAISTGTIPVPCQNSRIGADLAFRAR